MIYIYIFIIFMKNGWFFFLFAMIIYPLYIIYMGGISRPGPWLDSEWDDHTPTI